MKYLLSFIFLIGVAYGQTPTYTPMRSFYEFKGIKMDSLFLLPAFTDTTAANTGRIKSIVGSMIKAGNDIYMRYNNKWNGIGVATLDTPTLAMVLTKNRSLTSLADNNYQGELSGATATGNDNIGIGEYANYNGSGSYKIILGEQAGYQSQGQNLIAIGENAGDRCSALNGVFIGQKVGYKDSGDNNISIGRKTLDQPNTFDNLIMFGYDATATDHNQIVFANAASIYNKLRLKNTITADRLIRIPDSSGTFALTSNTIDKVDSLRRSNDSIFARKNNAWVYQYKNAAIPQDGPDRINGAATNSVDANIDGNDIQIRGYNNFEIKSFNDSAGIFFRGPEITIGDYVGGSTNINLLVGTYSGKIATNNGGSEWGLSVDYFNDDYKFGDFYNNTNHITIDNNLDSTIIKTGSLLLDVDKIYMNDASNKAVGSGTFSSGSVTINNTTVTADSKIFISYKNCVNCGTAYIDSITAGASFVVKSNNGSDDSDFNYLIIN